jgi:hypothetical protein
MVEGGHAKGEEMELYPVSSLEQTENQRSRSDAVELKKGKKRFMDGMDWEDTTILSILTELLKLINKVSFSQQSH